jgi:hypothetical protein
MQYLWLFKCQDVRHSGIKIMLMIAALESRMMIYGNIINNLNCFLVINAQNLLPKLVTYRNYKNVDFISEQF